MDSIIQSVPPAKRAQLQEVADLMLEIYLTLAEMQYIDESWIQRGPHDLTAQIPAYNSRVLRPAVIYLYSILPYLSTPALEDFLFRGEFADLRNVDNIGENRDPLWTEGRDERMTPWMTPLSFTGSNGAAIIYSTELHAIWIFAVGETESSDLVLKEDPRAGTMNSSGEHGIYTNIQCRPAPDVLRDINKWYRTLRITPGGGSWTPPEWSADLVRPLYEKHGWLTGTFDKDGFLVDQARALATIKIDKFFKDAKLEVEQAAEFLNWQQETKVRPLRDELNNIAGLSLDEEWMKRLKLLEEEMVGKRAAARLGREEERSAAIGEPRSEDMPLYHQDWLRFQVGVKKGLMQHDEEQYAEEPTTNAEENRIRGYIINQHKKAIDVCEKAYEAAKVDAERFCPGKTLDQVRDSPLLWDKTTEMQVEELKKIVAVCEEECEAVRGFIKTIPEAASRAKQGAEDFLQKEIDSLKSWDRKRLAWVEILLQEEQTRQV